MTENNLVNSLKLYKRAMKRWKEPSPMKKMSISGSGSSTNSLLISDNETTESSIEKTRDFSFGVGIAAASTPLCIFDDSEDWIPKKKAVVEDPPWLSPFNKLQKLPPKTYTPANKPKKTIILPAKSSLRTSSPQVGPVPKAKKALIENLDLSSITSSPDEGSLELKIYSTKGTINSEEIVASSLTSSPGLSPIKSPQAPSLIGTPPDQNPLLFKSVKKFFKDQNSTSEKSNSLSDGQILPDQNPLPTKSIKNSKDQNPVPKEPNSSSDDQTSLDDKDSLLCIPSPIPIKIKSSRPLKRKRTLYVAKDFLELF
uniref:uncharacterized protein LOC100184791 n=1 Tax=Ciona intestinalis TaxID=7719 RepID=UPI000180C825|nr:uncharacterized protein LOC100184791 [Ciona intestinalis]|eukprot:XP_004226881.1 uncharacterized protein LOC100184791 [Ciona intestinalis]